MQPLMEYAIVGAVLPTFVVLVPAAQCVPRTRRLSTGRHWHYGAEGQCTVSVWTGRWAALPAKPRARVDGNWDGAVLNGLIFFSGQAVGRSILRVRPSPGWNGPILSWCTDADGRRHA